MIAVYFDQFNIISLVGPFTNSWLMMMGALIVILLFLRGGRVIPNVWQSVMELAYANIRVMVYDNLGKAGQKYMPFILSLFMFIVILNGLGLFPYVFTPTVHIIITFGMSLSIIIGVTLLGFWAFRGNFLSILMPAGAPMVLAPFLIVVEAISYVSRAISLGVRLAANLIAGHLLFSIISGFAFSMLVGGLALLGLFPMLIMVFITLVEMAVAVIQAYVFCLLTTIYLGDTIALH